MQSSLLSFAAVAGLALANPMAQPQQKCVGPVVNVAKSNIAATLYCSSLLDLWPVTKMTTWTSTPPVITDTAYATNTSYTTSTYVKNVTVTSTTTTYPWTEYTCTPTAARQSHYKRDSSASPVPEPQAFKAYPMPVVSSACACLNLPTQTKTMTVTTVLPPVTTTTTLIIQTTSTVNTTSTALFTTTVTSSAPAFTHTVLSTLNGNFTSTTNNTSMWRSSPLVLDLYPGTDFPTASGFTQLSTGSSICQKASPYYISGMAFGTCSGFTDCMDICAAYSEGVLTSNSTAALCRGVTYGTYGKTSYCWLKSSVPGNATTSSCGQINSVAESAILDLPW